MSGAERDDTRMSRLLSLVLRHRPDRMGIHLDGQGWTDVAPLLAALARHGHRLTETDLLRIVTNDAKGRYSIQYRHPGRLDTARIRANQGHSVPVSLGLTPETPPSTLYHGAPLRALDDILATGLSRMARHDVHLSPDVETAATVGQRRGPYAVLAIDAAAMHTDGHTFTRSANGVWLVKAVPPQYLTVHTYSTETR